MNIEFDYHQTLKQADKLEEIAHNIKNLSSTDLESALSTLRSGWEGDVANNYLSKGAKLQEKTEKTAHSLIEAANRIRTIAQKLHAAEQAVLDIANNRSY